jgi:hypothetical protein
MQSTRPNDSRHRMPRIALAIATLIVAFAGLARAETVYVRSEDASLKSAGDADASEVATLPRGTELTVVSRQGSWVQVQTGGKTGWVHKLKVSPDKPESGGSALSGLSGGTRGTYAQEAESGRAARGLSPMAEKYAQAKALSPESIASVKRMEQYTVTKKEVQSFLKEGKLGEYAP